MAETIALSQTHHSFGVTVVGQNGELADPTAAPTTTAITYILGGTRTPEAPAACVFTQETDNAGTPVDIDGWFSGTITMASLGVTPAAGGQLIVLAQATVGGKTVPVVKSFTFVTDPSDIDAANPQLRG